MLCKQLARGFALVCALGVPVMFTGGCSIKNGTVAEVSPFVEAGSPMDKDLRNDTTLTVVAKPAGLDANGQTKWEAGDMVFHKESGMQGLANTGMFLSGVADVVSLVPQFKVAFWPETLKVQHSGTMGISAPGIEGNLGYIGDQIGYLGDQQGYTADQIGYLGDQVGYVGDQVGRRRRP